jgi:EF hand
MKKTILTLAVATLAIGAGLANANSKHLYVGPGYYAPGHVRYVAPVPYYRPAPVYYGGGYYGGGYHGRGYWRDGRWVAPVVVGATIGALAVAASTPVYAAPAPVYYPAPATYYNAPVDRFSGADLNGDGYLSYYEARRYGELHRNFGAIDLNGDGYLSRDEVNSWRYRW